MKSPNESRESIKAIFTDPRIPQQIDVTTVIMDQIKQNKEGFFVKYKVGILVAIGLLASITTGYAAVQYYQLKNPQGEVIYQEQDVSNANVKIMDKPDPETQAFIEKQWEINDSLQPGDAFAVYIVANNPKKHIVDLSKPFEYTSLAGLREKLGDQAAVPEKLPGDFVFLDGRVETVIKRGYKKEALYQQAESSKKGYVEQPLERTNDMNYVDINYQAGEQYMKVRISNFDDVVGNTVYMVNLDRQKKEKVKVGQLEVLYTEEDQSDHVYKEIVWVMETAGKKVEYRVSSRGEVLNKNNVDKFVKAFLPATK
ncbi:hypothetical protein BRE01_09590 [Brevibacillus reuszeri]|uniref:DUF4367 domain-containing protein n=1 Tax=Brevibacillus reuszeri TaxID=54915 RepID=A0A0K9YSE3_9BACL|nr:hypothetical protein [Brevibacillus reuszeri]KNB71591.1 hypothetical protein ADS79_22785 [Brevibacillus reuszeri]MED1855593.1 hypothetical protein [Brevibacillus reuszeri]GED67257.1 hypothetical protein BRE01_09590 [Brevibacillus reuszeri]